MGISRFLGLQKIGLPVLLFSLWEISAGSGAPPDERILSDGLENADDPKTAGCTTARGSKSITTSGAGLTVWMTGMSGSGKTTIAAQLEREFPGVIYRLDGDNLRKGLNRDLGFSDKDRNENNRRTAEVARLMNHAGLIVICALISPFATDRDLARDIHKAAGLDFMEVYVDSPLSVVELRDVKGLYKRARSGEIPHFTGISSPYEVPKAPDLHIHTDELTVNDSVNQLLAAIQNRTSPADKKKSQLECDSDDKEEVSLVKE